MTQRYVVDGQSGDWVVIDTTAHQTVYQSSKKRDCASWASIWNAGSTVGHDRMTHHLSPPVKQDRAR